MKRLTILFLEFLAGLAGNLIAGWIQQDIFNNLFSFSRLVGTILGAASMLLLILWLDMPNRASEKNRTISTPFAQYKNHIFSNNLGNTSKHYDVFISHASEDKNSLAMPLALALNKKGYRVWYDEFTLEIGDSIRASIDFGLSNSRYGIVILSKAFFEKSWPTEELNGLFARQMTGRKVILPIWHQITREELLHHSPLLADKLAISTDGKTIEEIVESLSTIIDNN